MYEIGSEFNYIDKDLDVRQDLTAMFEGFGDVRFLRCGRDAIGYVCEDIKSMEDTSKSASKDAAKSLYALFTS